MKIQNVFFITIKTNKKFQKLNGRETKMVEMGVYTAYYFRSLCSFNLNGVYTCSNIQNKQMGSALALFLWHLLKSFCCRHDE